MSAKDVLKVLAILALIVAAVAMFCYARVDLGMSLEDINQTLKQWAGKMTTLSVLIWSQIIVAGVASLGYRIWRHRVETAGK